MSILDNNDGKPYYYVRGVLTKELYRLIGEHFGSRILDEQIKDEPVLKMLNNMFDSVKTDQFGDSLQEVFEALQLLANQPQEKETSNEPT